MSISFGVARKTLVSDARTYILLAHSTDKHVLDIGVDLGLCRLGQKAAFKIILELELRPDDQMNNLVVNAVWPIIALDAQVFGAGERSVCPRHEGQRPAEPLAQDIGHDAAIGLLALPVELEVTAQFGGPALEQVNAVAGNNVADVGPGQHVVCGIRGREDGDVLVAEVLQEERTGSGPECRREVLLPVGEVQRRRSRRTHHVLEVNELRLGRHGVFRKRA